MTIVACVLKAGGIYTSAWVAALRRGVERTTPTPTRFVCLTDLPGDLPLMYGLPGWWSKLELFRPGALEGPTLYVDLDTLPVGDLGELLAYDGPLALLSDFYRPRYAQSGVMLFTPGDETAELWARFIAEPEAHMRRHRGDGEFIHAHTNGAPRIQALFPDQVVSLKVHARKAAPAEARLVCGHGSPRLSDPAAGWAHEEWLRA